MLFGPEIGAAVTAITVAVKFAQIGDQIFYADTDIQTTYKMTIRVDDQLKHVQYLFRLLPKAAPIPAWRKSQIERLICDAKAEILTVRKHLAIDDLLRKKAEMKSDPLVSRGIRAINWVFADRSRIIAYTPSLQMTHTSLSSISIELQIATNGPVSPQTTPTTEEPPNDAPPSYESTRKGYSEESRKRLVRGLSAMGGFES